jgi:hypothetical protein
MCRDVKKEHFEKRRLEKTKIEKNWWAVTDSNRRHPACKAGALPTELTALARRLSRSTVRRASA